MRRDRQKAQLVLSTGEKLEGELIGAPLTTSGELVFTTGMVGYSEAMTDPSYFGQILVFAYPLIGNYGIPELPTGLDVPIPRGFESAKVHTSGVIVTVDSPDTYHWNSLQNIDSWLAEHNVPGIAGLDTRHLIHLIRHSEHLAARIVPEESKGKRWLGDHVGEPPEGSFFDPGEHEVVREVSGKKLEKFGDSQGPKVGLIDCGVKWNILRQLVELGCEVSLVPWDYDFNSVECDGWVISNGPGNPEKTGDLTERVQALFNESRPVLGICLGHQILCRAAGATTSRMPYGHRSHNQPVNLVGTRKGFITSQNHGYVVDGKSLSADWEVWFTNVNDASIEGIKHKSKPFRSVQFHPEAAGGPRDTAWVLADFVEEVGAKCR